jgi:hypothetical protein
LYINRKTQKVTVGNCRTNQTYVPTNVNSIHQYIIKLKHHIPKPSREARPISPGTILNDFFLAREARTISLDNILNNFFLAF